MAKTYVFIVSPNYAELPDQEMINQFWKDLTDMGITVAVFPGNNEQWQLTVKSAHQKETLIDYLKREATNGRICNWSPLVQNPIRPRHKRAQVIPARSLKKNTATSPTR